MYCVSTVSTYDALKETITISVPNSHSFPCTCKSSLLSQYHQAILSQRQLLSLRCLQKLPRTHFFPFGMHQMMYQVSDISAKVSPRVDHKIFFVICHSSIFEYSLPLLPHHSLCKKTHLLEEQCFPPDVFTFCLCISYRHKKLQCFPAHHMHLTKISVHGAVIPFFVKFLFHCSDNGFLSIWIT